MVVILMQLLLSAVTPAFQPVRDVLVPEVNAQVLGISQYTPFPCPFGGETVSAFPILFNPFATHDRLLVRSFSLAFPPVPDGPPIKGITINGVTPPDFVGPSNDLDLDIDDANNPNQPIIITVDCSIAGDFFVRVSSKDTATNITSSVDGNLSISAPTSVCGDGVTEGAEVCDDGNATDVGICNAGCTAFTTCGDGTVQNPNGTVGPDQNEECDDAAANSDVTPNACRSTCKNPSCGDNVIDFGETCDDGNLAGGDGCSAVCLIEGAPAVCGNGATEGAEFCDDGNATDEGICNAGCTAFTTCGDGTVQNPNGTVGPDQNEECDDAAANSDVTANACRILCKNPSCGDNVIDFGETCDDGNLAGGDGCSAICLIEGAPAVCGNTIEEAGETCDDGNTNNGDGCNNVCIIESGGRRTSVSDGEGSDQADLSSAASSLSSSLQEELLNINPENPFECPRCELIARKLQKKFAQIKAFKGKDAQKKVLLEELSALSRQFSLCQKLRDSIPHCKKKAVECPDCDKLEKALVAYLSDQFPLLRRASTSTQKVFLQNFKKLVDITKKCVQTRNTLNQCKKDVICLDCNQISTEITQEEQKYGQLQRDLLKSDAKASNKNTLQAKLNVSAALIVDLKKALQTCDSWNASFPECREVNPVLHGAPPEGVLQCLPPYNEKDVPAECREVVLKMKSLAKDHAKIEKDYLIKKNKQSLNYVETRDLLNKDPFTVDFYFFFSDKARAFRKAFVERYLQAQESNAFDSRKVELGKYQVTRKNGSLVKVSSELEMPSTGPGLQKIYKQIQKLRKQKPECLGKACPPVPCFTCPVSTDGYLYLLNLKKSKISQLRTALLILTPNRKNYRKKIEASRESVFFINKRIDTLKKQIQIIDGYLQEEKKMITDVWDTCQNFASTYVTNTCEKSAPELPNDPFENSHDEDENITLSCIGCSRILAQALDLYEEYKTLKKEVEKQWNKPSDSKRSSFKKALRILKTRISAVKNKLVEFLECKEGVERTEGKICPANPRLSEYNQCTALCKPFEVKYKSQEAAKCQELKVILDWEKLSKDEKKDLEKTEKEDEKREKERQKELEKILNKKNLISRESKIIKAKELLNNYQKNIKGDTSRTKKAAEFKKALDVFERKFEKDVGSEFVEWKDLQDSKKKRDTLKKNRKKKRKALDKWYAASKEELDLCKTFPDCNVLPLAQTMDEQCRLIAEKKSADKGAGPDKIAGKDKGKGIVLPEGVKPAAPPEATGKAKEVYGKFKKPLERIFETEKEENERLEQDRNEKQSLVDKQLQEVQRLEKLDEQKK
jgi:cysteine-rich repeat protein